MAQIQTLTAALTLPAAFSTCILSNIRHESSWCLSKSIYIFKHAHKHTVCAGLNSYRSISEQSNHSSVPLILKKPQSPGWL